MNNDFLDEMLKIQEHFQTKNCYRPLIKDLADSIMIEGGELSVESGSKWWKKYIEDKDRWGKLSHEEAYNYIREVEATNIASIKEEAIDILHFWLCICLELSLSSKDIFELYCKKMNVNIDRQKSDY